MPILRSGHAPGHIRDTARNAFESWLDWDGESPEPTVEFEINYESREIPISQALGLVWNCTDIMPGSDFDRVLEVFETVPHLAPKRQTYAAAARAVLAHMQLTS